MTRPSPASSTTAAEKLQPAAHVAERVVAHDGDVAQRLAQVAAYAVHVVADRLDLLGERDQPALLAGGQGGDVGLAPGPEDGEPASHPGQPQVGADGEGEGDQRDDPEGDGQPGELSRGQGHPGRVLRGRRPALSAA